MYQRRLCYASPRPTARLRTVRSSNSSDSAAREGDLGGGQTAHARSIEPPVPLGRRVAARPDRGGAAASSRIGTFRASPQRAVRRQPNDRSPRRRDAHARGLRVPKSPPRDVRRRAPAALQRRELHTDDDRRRSHARDRGAGGRHAGARPRSSPTMLGIPAGGRVHLLAATANGEGRTDRHREHPPVGRALPGPSAARPHGFVVGAPAARTTTYTR